MLNAFHRRRFVGLFASAGVALTTNLDRTEAVAPVANDLTERLEAAMRSFADAGRFSGAVLVERRGETLLEAAYGIANRITEAANSPETVYQIASLTKAFTALACVQLQEAGRLSLDEPITTYLPEVIHAERDGVAVTTRHLLAHTSGVPDFIGFYDANNPLTYPRTFDQLLGDIIAHELEFTPGTQFAYGNSGYIYAGLIIERASGQEYEAYLREHLLTAAGMASTFLADPPDPEPPISKGYGMAAGQLVATSDFGRIDLAWSAGGLSSTIGDLRRWHEALQTERLAPRAAIEAMYEPVLDHYGLGWERQSIAGHFSIGHEGHTIGYDAKLARFLADGVVIVLLSNLQDAPVNDITEQLAEIVFAG
jgi:CubicO group peptidase (beta-lactamase class C family)